MRASLRGRIDARRYPGGGTVHLCQPVTKQSVAAALLSCMWLRQRLCALRQEARGLHERMNMLMSMLVDRQNMREPRERELAASNHSDQAEFPTMTLTTGINDHSSSPRPFLTPSLLPGPAPGDHVDMAWFGEDTIASVIQLRPCRSPQSS